jgi:hypothetical protein
MTFKATRFFRLGVLGILFPVSMNSLAYKEETHEDMSESAAYSSVLSQASKLNDLGLLYAIDDANQTFPYPDGKEPLTILKLFRFGARFEDSGSRAINHFFNPLDWQPLTVVNPFTGEIIGFLGNDNSPAWALEDLRDISGNDAGEQKFSYKDARQYFYDALTKPDKADRDENWGLTFQTLGQVIHHLQDMAQPQHVRNDAHLDQPDMNVGGVQLNPLYNPSSYELWTFKHPPAASLFSAYAPVYSPDETGNFTTPRQFWTTTVFGTGGNGIAEYTNRGFFSAGTLGYLLAFPSPDFLPSYDGQLFDIAAVCTELQTDCPPGISGNIKFFGNTVVDTLRPEETKFKVLWEFALLATD